MQKCFYYTSAYGYKERITVCTIFKKPQRKNSSRKKSSQQPQCCQKMPLGAPLRHVCRAGLKATRHTSLNAARRFDQCAAVISGLFLRGSAWLAFSKFPVENSAHQAGMQPAKSANVSAAGGG